MPWIKKNLIYKPEGLNGWDCSHSYVVCADNSYSDKVRVYFSARDTQGRCQATFVDLNADNLSEVLYVCPEPILALGQPGTFDDCGITPTWFLNVRGQKWLYYVGWNVRNTVPYHNAVGLAISNNGTHFQKAFDGPLVSTIATEPYFNGSACVLNDNGIFKIWYLNCTSWIEIEGKQEPCYHIKYAESDDGINWKRNGTVAIDYKDDIEGGISRPTVLKEDGIYKMWYSTRAKQNYRDQLASSYRIGYAESLDGIKWTRKDHEVGIDVSAEGWDSDMIEYPMVFVHRGQKILFYNGNGFGKTGFGYAIWQD